MKDNMKDNTNRLFIFIDVVGTRHYIDFEYTNLISIKDATKENTGNNDINWKPGEKVFVITIFLLEVSRSIFTKSEKLVRDFEKYYLAYKYRSIENLICGANKEENND